MTRPPDFDELVGAEVPAQERERLRRAHELLMEAGPPPELSPALETVPRMEETPRWFRQGKRRVGRRVVLLAAALATAAALGFMFGHSTNPNSISTERVVTLAGTSLRPQASGTLELDARTSNRRAVVHGPVRRIESLCARMFSVVMTDPFVRFRHSI